MASGTPAEVRGQFNRRLLEISGPGLSSARRSLQRDALPRISVNRFGDRLHVVYDDPEQEYQVRTRLIGESVEIREVAPTIEDTFVALMEESEAAA